MSSRILAALNDPGGTQALVPVLETLRASRAQQLELVAGPFAEPFLRARGLPFRREAATVAREEAAAIFRQYEPTLLVTGTSWQSNLEQSLRDQAVKAGIPSIVLLDFWSNYALRWQGAAYQIQSLADTVCVPDEMAAREMNALGFPNQRLRVTGQPFLEEIFAKGGAGSEFSRAGQYLFLSQPGVADGRSLSQAEHLALLVAALTDIARERNRPVFLKIRLHPKERELTFWPRLVAQLASQECPLALADHHRPVEADLAEAEWVIGYYTMALFQARALGKRTVSLDVYARGEGLRGAMQAAGIVETPLAASRLRALLAEESGAVFSPNFHQGAREKVLAVLSDCQG